MRLVCTELLTRVNMPLSETEKLWIYNGIDACVPQELVPIFNEQFDSVTRRAYEFEREMLGPILEMNMRGVRIDAIARDKAIASYSSDLAYLEDNLQRILLEGLGLHINWRSNIALLDLFYNVLKLPVVKKRNAKGDFAPTVNRDALEKLENYFHAKPIVAHILALRDIGKKIGFLRTGVDNDGRIRTSYNIGGTTTGRLSSSFSDFGTGTNLQNIESRLRKIFIPDRGYKFCNIDLEQSDSRAVGAIIWNLFHHGSYLDACESGDLHSAVSEMVWPGVPPRNIFYRHFTHRDATKRLGHATNFMGQPQEISKQVKIPINLVKDFQHLYLNRFPYIPRWWNERRERLLSDGYLTSLLGMQRYFFGRRNDPQTLKQLIAFEPQNTTAWTINEGLLAVWGKRICQVMLQVHDSILVQYKEEDENWIVPLLLETTQIQRELKHGRLFTIPAEAKVGWNWADATEENPNGLKKWTGHDTCIGPTRPSPQIVDRIL